METWDKLLKKTPNEGDGFSVIKSCSDEDFRRCVRTPFLVHSLLVIPSEAEGSAVFTLVDRRG
jgi:hypothetical protein